jgi:hypothetical protein
MNSHTRNLSFRAEGDEVALLHDKLRRLGAEIADDEVDIKTFGHTTQQAVRTIQERNRLEPTGFVDERTAELITSQVDALDAAGRGFLVYGRIEGAEGVAITVRAVDKDLRSEEPLGEVRSRNGHYAITYNADQFDRAEKGHGDLVVLALHILRSCLRDKEITTSAANATDKAGPSEVSKTAALTKHLQAGIAADWCEACDSHCFATASCGCDDPQPNHRRIRVLPHLSLSFSPRCRNNYLPG